MRADGSADEPRSEIAVAGRETGERFVGRDRAGETVDGGDGFGVLRAELIVD